MQMLEFKNFIIPLRKWWWLIALSVLLTAITSAYVVRRQPSLYQASTTLLIGRTIEDPNPASNSFTLSQQLAATYADIANREGVRSKTQEALGLARLPDYTAAALPQNQLIVITVKDTNPKLAQTVANELANQLVLMSPTAPTQEEQSRTQFVSGQLDKLEGQIKDTEDEIQKLQDDLGDMVSALQINDTENQINALQGKLNTMQSNYADLLSNTTNGALNILSVIEPAVLPGRPIASNGVMIILLATAGSLALSFSAAYLLEYLDDSLRNPDDIANLLGRPVIGFIPKIHRHRSAGIYVADHPRPEVEESFHSLWSNLRMQDSARAKSLLISSVDTQAGKTTVAANLAWLMSRHGKKVILIDADLRRPGLHSLLEIENENGLSDYLEAQSGEPVGIPAWVDENLAVITSGASHTNPIDLLNSFEFPRLLERLARIADMVIIDGPPLMVADAFELASRVDKVLLIIQPGHTRKSMAQTLVKQLSWMKEKVIGIALNAVTRKNVNYYDGFFSYRSYYRRKSSQNGKGPAMDNERPNFIYRTIVLDHLTKEKL